MTIPVFRAILGAALVAISGGCAGTALQPAAPSIHGSGLASARVQETSGTTTIFTSEYNRVGIYDENGSSVGTISGFSNVYGVAVNSAAGVWVTDVGNYQVRLYPPPYTAAARTLGTPAGIPVGIAIDNAPGPKHDLLAVTQFSSGQTRSVSFYRSTDVKPCKTIPVQYGNTSAFDARGNLYVADGSTIQLIAGGCAASGEQQLQLPAGQRHAVSLAVALDGDIYVLNENFNAAVLYDYAPPVNGAFGKPKRQLAFPEYIGEQFALTADGKYVWVMTRLPGPEEFDLTTKRRVTAFPALGYAYYGDGLAVSPPAVP